MTVAANLWADRRTTATELCPAGVCCLVTIAVGGGMGCPKERHP